MALLGRSEVSPQIMSDRTEQIRELMLLELGRCKADAQSGIARRVRYALDAQGLWYLRSELMAALASSYGETIASQKIAGISNMFRGLLPDSLIRNLSGRRR